MCTTNVHINYDFILSKSLNSPNLYFNWGNMWYSDYQNKKLSLCMFNSFKGFHSWIKWAIMSYPKVFSNKTSIYCIIRQQQFKKISYKRLLNYYFWKALSLKICLERLWVNQERASAHFFTKSSLQCLKESD